MPFDGPPQTLWGQPIERFRDKDLTAWIDDKAYEDTNVIWRPHAGGQQRFLAARNVFEVLGHGNRGGGKTDCLIMDFMQDCGKGYGPAWRGVLFRETYPQLADVIAKTKKWLPQIVPGIKYNASEHYWLWPTGEVLMLRHFKRPDDYWNFHGHEIPWQGWEELTNWATDEGYKRMISCARSSTPGIPARIRSTTNPYGKGHNWIKHRFRLPFASDRVIIHNSFDDNGNREPMRMSIKLDLQDNRSLMEADPGYQQRMLASARNEAERKAWQFGSWDIVAGGMFDDVWSPDDHILPYFEVPHTWTIDRSFDWGSSKPFSVGWWAKSDGTDLKLPSGEVFSTVRGDIFRINEWYGWNKKPNQGLNMDNGDIALGIVEREIAMGIYGRVKPGPADTSIFNIESGYGIADQMSRRLRVSPEMQARLKPGQLGRDGKLPGVEWTRADKSPGSRVAGWQGVRQALKNAKPKDDYSPREYPGLFVTEACSQFIRTIPVLPRCEKNPDDVDTEVEDHIGDETRYRVRKMNFNFGAGTHIGMT